MKKIEKVTIGADIELFLYNKVANEIASAEGFVKGTKDQPFVFDPTSKYFATSLDNVLMEFCIPPANNRDEFFAYISKSVNYINASLPKEYCSLAVPAATLDPKYLQTEQAKVFGCEPDYNAYTGQANVKPYCEDPTLRSAGGHIHIGYASPDKEMNREIIKALDLFIGVPAVLIEPDSKRKELYGKAGCYRDKEYGVEYRTISNFYLKNRRLTQWVYDNTINAVEWLNKGNSIDSVFGDHLEKVINNNDRESAIDLIEAFKINIKTA